MTTIRVRAVDPEEYPALVDLVLREQPHLERAEFAPLLHDDAIVRERFVVAAYDGDVPVGCGLLLRPPGNVGIRRINAELGYGLLFGVLRMRRLRPDGSAIR